MSNTYRHPDGEDAPYKIGEHPEWRAFPDEEGEFEADISPERAQELGFEVVEVSEDGGDGDEGDSDESPETLEDLTNDELKEIARDLGIAEDVNLNSNESIIEGIREVDGDEVEP